MNAYLWTTQDLKKEVQNELFEMKNYWSRKHEVSECRI